MKETKDDSLFAELTPEESASVNGGHYSKTKLLPSDASRRVPPELRRLLQSSVPLLVISFPVTPE
jgi:hypothetical protein